MLYTIKGAYHDKLAACDDNFVRDDNPNNRHMWRHVSAGGADYGVPHRSNNRPGDRGLKTIDNPGKTKIELGNFGGFNAMKLVPFDEAVFDEAVINPGSAFVRINAIANANQWKLDEQVELALSDIKNKWGYYKNAVNLKRARRLMAEAKYEVEQALINIKIKQMLLEANPDFRPEHEDMQPKAKQVLKVGETSSLKGEGKSSGRSVIS